MKRGSASARRLLLRRIITEREITNQEELVSLLDQRGYRVTQTTVSRDLAAIGAQKVAGREADEVYTVGTTEGTGSRKERALGRLMQQFVLGIESSRNIVVLKTAPGAANPVAAALDRSPPDGVLGTIAGDDTVLVITRDDNGGSEMADRLAGLLGS
jgi:transcriptional regulator of arginine metabolism